MVHAHKRNLPGNGKTFGRVYADREAGSYARSARDGDDIGLALRDACCPGLGGIRWNWDGARGVEVGAGCGYIREGSNGGSDQGGEVLLVRFQCHQRVDAGMLAIVRRDLFVEVEGC